MLTAEAQKLNPPSLEWALIVKNTMDKLKDTGMKRGMQFFICVKTFNGKKHHIHVKYT